MTHFVPTCHTSPSDPCFYQRSLRQEPGSSDVPWSMDESSCDPKAEERTTVSKTPRSFMLQLGCRVGPSFVSTRTFGKPEDSHEHTKYLDRRPLSLERQLGDVYFVGECELGGKDRSALGTFGSMTTGWEVAGFRRWMDRSGEIWRHREIWDPRVDEGSDPSRGSLSLCSLFDFFRLSS